MIGPDAKSDLGLKTLAFSARRAHASRGAYMQVSLRDGTDRPGRQFALDALNTILDNGWEVVIDDEPFDPPTVGNEVI